MELNILTDAELDDLRIEVVTEQERRDTLANAPTQVEQISRAWADASGRKDGDPWTQPTGAHDAYPLGAVVTDAGKMWISLIPANVWRPGVSGWREQVAQGYPVWVQPTGGHDAYKVGDRVSFEGGDYESTIAGNVWSPTAYPAGWRKL